VNNEMRKVSPRVARRLGVLLLGCLLIPALAWADTLTCKQVGPHTVLITEKLVPGVDNEVTACMLPAGLTPPAADTFFDLTEPNPADPLLPVSDYFDITTLGLVTLTSDPLEIGLPARPLATSVPEVGTERKNGAIITVGGVTYDVMSDMPGRAAVPEPSPMLLIFTGVVLLGVSNYCNRNRSA
jgi:hypothetical protein